MAYGSPLGTSRQVAEDFDNIAQLPEQPWNHNVHYHDLLLGMFPPKQRVLEVGCGKGRLARSLAEAGHQVDAIDLSASMVHRAASTTYTPIRFICGDYLRHAVTQPYNAIVSVATVHHMNYEDFLRKAKSDLNPGGTLFVLDLYERAGPFDKGLGLIAMPPSLLLRLVHNGRLRPRRHHRALWAAHARNDQYMTIKELQDVATSVLPGSRIKRLLFWRYLLTWQKPRVTRYLT